METVARWPVRWATCESSSSSGSDSTLKQDNALLQAKGHFAGGLADAGKDDLAAGNAGGQGAAQLAFGDHIHAGAEIGHGLDHGLVGIGLHGIADEWSVPLKASLMTR